MATNNRLRNNCQVQIAHHETKTLMTLQNLDPELKNPL
jgi:hypothetical protein